MKSNIWRKIFAVCICLGLLTAGVGVGALAEPEATALDAAQAEGLAEDVLLVPMEGATEEDDVAAEEPAAEELTTDEQLEADLQQEILPAEEAPATEEAPGDNAEAIAQFFGIESIKGNEAFYEALYRSALGRAGGMPLTIAVPNGDTPIVFNGAMQSVQYTTGTVTTQIAMPDYYAVTFEVVTEGRLPGTYGPQIISLTVMDTKNNVDMTRYFDAMVTGGQMEITASGSLLMISADDYEFEFDGFTHPDILVTTGTALVNWMPISDELQVNVEVYGFAPSDIIGEYEMWDVESYSIVVIEDEFDITNYFDHIYVSSGKIIVTPPLEKIPVTLEPGLIRYSDTQNIVTAEGRIVSLNGVSIQEWGDRYTGLSASLKTGVRPDLAEPGEHTLTEEDWHWVSIGNWMSRRSAYQATDSFNDYFVITILPCKLIR